MKSETPNTPQKELLCFESIELELGLSTTTEDNAYTCPIFLHKDESRPGRYFATHSAGIHSVSITCLKDLQIYINGSTGMYSRHFGEEKILKVCNLDKPEIVKICDSK